MSLSITNTPHPVFPAPLGSPWERIWQAVVEIFEAFQERISFYWDAFRTWVSATSSTFCLFRVAEIVHPSLSSWLERTYLYGTQFFHDLSARERELTLQQECLRLTTEGAELRELLQRLGRERRASDEERQALGLQYDQAQIRIDFLQTRLAHLGRDLGAQQQEIQALQTALAASREAINGHKVQMEGAIELNRSLQSDITALIAERNALQTQVNALFESMLQPTKRTKWLQPQT